MKQKIIKQVNYWLGVTAIGLVLGMSLQFARAWTEPATAPPGGNVGAPINTGSADQYKTGDLEIRANDAPRFRATDVGESSKYIEMQYNNGWGRLYTDGSNIYTNRLFRADGGFQVDGRWAISSNNYMHSARSTEDNHYGFFEVRRNDGQRGAYFGWGSPGNYVDLRLENGNDLAINGGNVGIGTTSPSEKLTVNGGISLSGGNVYYINGIKGLNSGGAPVHIHGSVGIGTTTPTQKLDVDGVIRTSPRSSATCNASAEGGIYYDSDDNHFYGCNGSSWVQLDSSGAVYQ